MRKHPLVKNMRKLNFHLVPMSGVAKRTESEKKFRAEFVRGHGEGTFVQMIVLKLKMIFK